MNEREYDKELAGARIAAFWSDEFVQMAFQNVRDTALQMFKTAKDDTELRRAQATIRVTDAFEGLLKQMVEEGQLARTPE